MNFNGVIIVAAALFWTWILMYFGFGIIYIAETWAEVLDFIAISILSTSILFLLSLFDSEIEK